MIAQVRSSDSRSPTTTYASRARACANRHRRASAPLAEEPGVVLLVIQDASAARALDRQLSFRNAARCVAGMAAILAHEVKNPLSGIRGAAQLLEPASATPIANWPC